MYEDRCEKCGMLKSNHKVGSDECPSIGVTFNDEQLTNKQLDEINRHKEE